MPNDIAFKVIIKNDGISDIIFKTLMLKGEAGGTIASIEKTSTSGVVDTYTITLNDGTTTTFEVTNGSNIQSIEKTATAGLIDTYTVTLTNGDTSTFEVKNGEDAQLYELPKDCVVGYDHEPTQVTETYYDRYIQLDDVNGISSVKYNGNTLQETNDGRNLYDISQQTINPARKNTYLIITLSANTDYTFSLDVAQNGLYIQVNDGSTWQDFKTAYNTKKISFNTGENTTVRLNTYSANGNLPTEFQLEVGSTATPYQPYCGGIPSPNPSYPKEIVGVGEKQSNNTYSVDLVAEDPDGNVYTVTASGLTHPVYQDDWIDLVAGKLHRANGYIDLGPLSWSGGLISSNPVWYSSIPNPKLPTNSTIFNGKAEKYIPIRYNGVAGTINTIAIRDNGILYVNNGSDTIQPSGNLLYELATATEEDITLTGDLEQVKRIRGEYVYIDAPLRTGSTEITFGQETDFPDGYEEIDFPLDDMFYYQPEEYVDFPKNWGFVMGYVFDANTIRFVMNVTKALKEGMTVDITRSADLSLNTYAGAGDVGILSGFSGNAVSWIPELGQIQISLTTESPHGLTPNMLLGARVATGTLRIYFVED